MKILQGNLHRSRTADALLDRLITEWEPDLLIISEQYRNRGSPTWYTDVYNTAAIWVPNPGTVPVEYHSSGRGFVWIRCLGITYVSCYLTPNESIHDFREKIDALEDTFHDRRSAMVIAGDFNARATEWGMPTTDARGRYILEMAARLGLSVANSGNTPTFRRPGQLGTVPDITLVSDVLAQQVKNWRVLEDYTGSDHQYIIFYLQQKYDKTEGILTRRVGWNLSKLNEEAFSMVIEQGKMAVVDMQGLLEETVSKTMGLVRQACDASMPKRKKFQRKRTPVYWWTAEIAMLRKNCLRLRRVTIRARRRNGINTEEKIEEFKQARRALKRAIILSKREKWEELRCQVDQDPWGLGYKLVMRKLGSLQPPPRLDAKQMREIVEKLFPTHPRRERPLRVALEESVQGFIK
ncbi:uncharacterized protein [Rhodnius prolixus]|uniref:uncharacterized protein n=1 Tax=Rhodnius prolixus TaxID=13249 RepID=UPI003D18C1D3